MEFKDIIEFKRGCGTIKQQDAFQLMIERRALVLFNILFNKHLDTFHNRARLNTVIIRDSDWSMSCMGKKDLDYLVKVTKS